MLRSQRALLWGLRRRFSTEIDKPPEKRVTHFDPTRQEVYVQDILDRESPCLILSEGKAERPPFIKHIFQKKFDERFLTYPDVLDPGQVDDINAFHERVKTYVDTLDIACLNNGVPAEVPKKLEELDVFKIFLPRADGGLELTMTNMARIMEAFGSHPQLGAIVAAHNIAGVRTIANHGSAMCRAEYLPMLKVGKPVLALALEEETFDTTKTTARIDERTCVLNGKKIFVRNGEKAELFVVVCDVEGESGQAAIIVDRKREGVLVEPSPETHGLKGAGLTTVYFRNVEVPVDNVFGEKSKRSTIAQNITASMRSALSAGAAGAARLAFDQAFRKTYCTERFQQLLCKNQLVQEQLTEIALEVFIMESCVYMTTAIEDVVENPDYFLESLVTAITCLNSSRKALHGSADMFGAHGRRLNHPTSMALDDIVNSPYFFASPREQALSVARVGLQNTKSVAKISQLPAPVERSVDKALQLLGGPGKDTHLKNATFYQFLHPSLINAANILDFMNRRFGALCEGLVSKFGDDAIDNVIVLEHISGMLLDIFALSNVLARGSRSYCIGLFNGYEEVKLGGVLSRILLERFQQHSSFLEDILKEKKLPDASTGVTACVFAEKQYFILHPLHRSGDTKSP